jgi:hypothetical protein
MVNRRDFLRFGALAAAGTVPGLRLAQAAPGSHAYFGLHPRIEQNPKAVFIRRTNVAHKMDAPAKLREGLTLSRQIFVPMDKPGIPLTHRIVLKPNATGVYDRTRAAADNWGVGTDPQFYEGMVSGLKELGLKRFDFVESTGYDTWEIRGFNDVNERLGVNIGEPQRRPKHLRDGYAVNWAKVPDGVVFQRIPHYAPVGESGHLASGYRQMESARNVPDAVRQEHAGPGSASLHAILRRLEKYPDQPAGDGRCQPQGRAPGE